MSGGRNQAARLIDLLSEWFDVTVLAPDRDAAEYPVWSSAVRRVARRRRSQWRRTIDAAAALVHGRQVLLERMIRAGAPQAAREVARDVHPRLLILGRPMFDDFATAAPGAALLIEANEDLVRATRSMALGNVSLRARFVSLVDVAVVGRQQRRNYPRAAAVLVCSPVEQELIAPFAESARIHVLPNTVDVPCGVTEVRPIHAVAFVGSFGYPPNEAAALELVRHIMPAVRVLGGPHRATLIGSRPTARIRRLVDHEPDVSLLADAPSIVEPLRAAGVLAVPIRHGAGTRVKILEAIAAGVPVVSTRFGIEGLDLEPDKEVLLAETPEEFAASIMALQQSFGRRRALIQAARQKVEAKYTMPAARSVVGQILEELSEEGVADSPGRSADG
jgi:glycosyltransferase involved in cell wall biosynthesis